MGNEIQDKVASDTHAQDDITDTIDILVERKLTEITRTWENLLEKLIASMNETNSPKVFSQYANAFPASYRDHFTPQEAMRDIRDIETLNDKAFCLKIYHTENESDKSLCLKLFAKQKPIDLSDIIPILENFGFHVKGEHPYRIECSNGKTIWLHDFTLSYKLDTAINLSTIHDDFIDAFSAIWLNHAENDRFNRLAIGAQLGWREVVLLRAYARYLKQARVPYSLNYIADTLTNHPEITRKLISLFKILFSREANTTADGKATDATQRSAQIIECIDLIANLDEDRIMRHFLTMITATLRTNFYQPDNDGKSKNYISLKLSPKAITFLPAPRPAYEIFVYSSCFEGVHLRGGKISRGGLRWSDRPQDYRTEVLGLLKAQQVKNSVIVPTGAKGVFVAKQDTKDISRSELRQEGISCYQYFIQGLLDVTDNIINGEIVPPDHVICRDDDDPYLVVAADKGTATFSDIANKIAIQRNFWLGDAFASGGSHGYDHKAMGITARGAWVAVQRHFRELGINIQKQDFSVVGIGDMSGDVFGNGMLLSPRINLIAAFNHQHIFIDPNPDAQNSFAERQRLFETPHSTWASYDSNIISEGGGIFSRTAKHIYITPQMKSHFDITESHLTPNELINRLLKSRVDLIWNGGIGTYVKSASESNADADDKTNDSLRVNGRDLRCRVFGEGGNLGLTQAGRIEYCLNGGICNTDFIDNAAGVDCSDHEVNIKILLDSAVANGEITETQRNVLLADMTQEISDLVLHNNYRQTQAISLAENRPNDRLNEYLGFINDLENEGRLNRKLEGLPEDTAILDRGPNGYSLTRPELSILISYAKEKYQQELLNTDVAEDPYLVKIVESAFPEVLRKSYSKHIYSHRLKREIISTKIANEVIDNMGVIFYRRIMLSSNATLSQVTKAYTVAREIFQLEDFWINMELLDYRIPASLQFEMMHKLIIRVQQTIQWLLYNRENNIDPTSEIKAFLGHINNVRQSISKQIQGKISDGFQSYKEDLMRQEVPLAIAERISLPTPPCITLGIVEAANQTSTAPEIMAGLYIALGERIGLIWLIKEASGIKPANHWQSRACCAFIGEIEQQLRRLSITAASLIDQCESTDEILDRILDPHQTRIDTWLTILSELQGAPTIEFALFGILTSQLNDIASMAEHSVDNIKKEQTVKL